jgi:hypothetical protein
MPFGVEHSDLPYNEQPQPQRLRVNTITNVLEFTTDNGVTWNAAGGGALSWFDQRRLRALQVLNYGGNVQVDYPINFDYTRGAPVLSGTTPIDTAYTGIVYALTGAPSTLNDLPQSGANLISWPKAQPWYVAHKVSFAGLMTTSYCLPLGLDNGVNYIEVSLQFGNANPQHLYLAMGGGTGTVNTDLGASFALGSANVPNGPPVTIAIYHDMVAGALAVEVNDVEATRIVASGGGLDAMPTAPLALDAQCNCGPVGLRVHGGFAMLQTPQ